MLALVNYRCLNLSAGFRLSPHHCHGCPSSIGWQQPRRPTTLSNAASARPILSLDSGIILFTEIFFSEGREISVLWMCNIEMLGLGPRRTYHAHLMNSKRILMTFSCLLMRVSTHHVPGIVTLSHTRKDVSVYSAATLGFRIGHRHTHTPTHTCPQLAPPGQPARVI